MLLRYILAEYNYNVFYSEIDSKLTGILIFFVNTSGKTVIAGLAVNLAGCFPLYL